MLKSVKYRIKYNVWLTLTDQTSQQKYETVHERLHGWSEPHTLQMMHLHAAIKNSLENYC